MLPAIQWSSAPFQRGPAMTEAADIQVRESKDKVRLTTKVKRGTGTRDQDEVKVSIRAAEPEEAVRALTQTLEGLEAADTVECLRETQPGETDE